MFIFEKVSNLMLFEIPGSSICTDISLWPRVVVAVRVLSIGERDLFENRIGDLSSNPG